MRPCRMSIKHLKPVSEETLLLVAEIKLTACIKNIYPCCFWKSYAMVFDIFTFPEI